MTDDKYGDATIEGPTIKLGNLGDGLSKNVPVRPIDNLTIGDKVYLAVEAVVVGDGLTAANTKDPTGDDLVPVYVLRGLAVTFVDKVLVAEVLAEQQRRNEAAAFEAKKAKEAEAGIAPLFDGNADGTEKPAKKASAKKASAEPGLQSVKS